MMLLTLHVVEEQHLIYAFSILGACFSLIGLSNLLRPSSVGKVEATRNQVFLIKQSYLLTRSLDIQPPQTGGKQRRKKGHWMLVK